MTTDGRTSDTKALLLVDTLSAKGYIRGWECPECTQSVFYHAT